MAIFDLTDVHSVDQGLVQLQRQTRIPGSPSIFLVSFVGKDH